MPPKSHKEASVRSRAREKIKGRLNSSRLLRHRFQSVHSSQERARTSIGWFSPFQTAQWSLQRAGSTLSGKTSRNGIESTAPGYPRRAMILGTHAGRATPRHAPQRRAHDGPSRRNDARCGSRHESGSPMLRTGGQSSNRRSGGPAKSLSRWTCGVAAVARHGHVADGPELYRFRRHGGCRPDHHRSDRPGDRGGNTRAPEAVVRPD